MGNVLIRSRIDLSVAKNPTVGDVLSYKDKTVANEYQGSDYNETSGGMFSIPAGAVDTPLAMGTVAIGRILYIEVVANLDVKLVNSAGTGQKLVFKPKIASILNIDFTGILVSNSSASAVVGQYAVVGD